MTACVVAWINNTELARKFLELAKTMGLNVRIPRSGIVKCNQDTVVITDDKDIYSRINKSCKVLLVEYNNILLNIIDIVSFLAGNPSEILVGVDLGKEKLAYVVIAAGSVLDYGICVNCLKDFVKKICELKSRRVFVGIGYTDSVSNRARELYSMLTQCGVKAIIVDEERSNKTLLIGLRGSELLRKTDLRAAAIVALRSRSCKGLGKASWE